MSDFQAFDSNVNDLMASKVAQLDGRLDPLMTGAVAVAAYATTMGVVSQTAVQLGEALAPVVGPEQAAAKVAFILELLSTVNEMAAQVANEYLHGTD